MIGFRVCVMVPQGYPHAACFSETAILLRHSLESLGYDCDLAISAFSRNRINIILGVNLLPPETRFDDHRVILYQLEQLSDHEGWFDPEKGAMLARADYVWDYDPANIAFLDRIGISATYVPLGFHPLLRTIPEDRNKDIDVLLVGSLNDRRRKILSQLRERGYTVKELFGVYGRKRDAYVARSRILINIHYYDASIFEAVRVSYLLNNGIFVLSEESPHYPWEGVPLPRVPYEGLIDACEFWLSEKERLETVRREMFETFSAGYPMTSILGKVLRGGQLCTPPQRAGISETALLSHRDVPKKLNIGSGKDFRSDCLNVDVNDYWRPDIVLDLCKTIDFEKVHQTRRFGSVQLQKHHFQEILANDVLEHLPDLRTAMTSCLELLREGGRLHVRVPYDLSHGAWQDPTHVRGFNERSWLYYTDWFWYLGWTEARFDLEEMEFLPSPWGKELIAKGMLETDLCRQPRAIDEIRVVLRKRTLSPEESKIADGFLRRRELDGSQSVHPFPHAHPPEPGSQKRKSPPPAPIQKKGQSYYTGLNQRLLRSVPPTAHEILEVGCAEGRLGEALRSAQQGRRVYGIEREPAIAARAEARLDKVFCLDVEKEVPDLPLGSLDALLFGDVLEHLHAPLDVLRRYAPLLKPSGHALCCIPNVQHHSVLAPLIRGEFQYRDQGLLDSSHYRFFTWASFTKLMLDAGFAPTIRDAVSVPISQPLLEAFRPLFDHLGVEQERMEHYVSTYQWIFEGRPLGWDEDFPEIPLSFVACVNNEAQLSENLAASPCFQESGAHELILIRGAQSASEGFCAGIERAQHEVVVFLHQDVYLPKNWPRRFAQQWLLASERFGGMGVAGVYGACHDNAVQGGVLRTGHVVDRHTLLNEPRPLPACVETLDEVLLAIPRSTPLRPDPALGFHLYGADLALQARKAGLSCVALDAPCFHNSVTGSRLPPAYQHSAEVLRGQWSGCLPIATPCALIH